MPPIKQLKSLECEEEIIGIEKTVTYLFPGIQDKKPSEEQNHDDTAVI
jgi:glutamyl-tRNA reductase